MPRPVETPRIATAAHCFCGHIASQGSIYCSPHCARDDALNSLTLGKPHECESALPPLPTLPPGFFDLPPRRGKLSILDPDEFDISLDQGPFQSKPSVNVMERIGNNSKLLPRSVTKTAGSECAKWKSHYQKEQAHEGKASLGIPFLLVNTVASGEEVLETRSRRQDDPDLLTPVTRGQREKEQSRIGSFGDMSKVVPLLISKDVAGDRSDISSRPRHSVNLSKRPYTRSSSSSYVSGLTSGTSRTSYASSTATSDVSPTKSEYPVPVSEARPRYGSIFGNAAPSSSPVVQSAVDVQDTLFPAKRQSRRRSNTVVTPRVEKTPMNLAWNRSTHNLQREEQTKLTFDDDQEVIDIKPLRAPKLPSPVNRKLGGVPVSKFKWSQITSPTAPPELPQAALPPLPSRSLPPTRPTTPHGAPGTVVKSTTMGGNRRLPIGTTSLKTPPKVPSNTPSSAFNVSMQSRSYRVPAYAMNVPKIPSSTRTLHTSPSNKSLKSKKSESNIRIPSVNDEEGTCPVQRPQPSLEHPLPRSITDPRNLMLALNTDPVELHQSSESSTVTPPVASPTSTASTFGVPSTPRPWALLPNTERPFWTMSPTKGVIAITEQDLVSRIGSDVSHSDMSTCSSAEEIGQATLCVAQRMTVHLTSSNTILDRSISEVVSR